MQIQAVLQRQAADLVDAAGRSRPIEVEGGSPGFPGHGCCDHAVVSARGDAHPVIGPAGQLVHGLVVGIERIQPQVGARVEPDDARAEHQRGPASRGDSNLVAFAER